MATSDDATNIPDLPLIDAFLSKLSQFDKYELCSQQSSHWLLSTNDFKVPTEPPLGIITSMMPINGNSSVVLLPTIDNSEGDVLDIRLVHQLIRELTFGIYALNSLPACSLEANYDQVKEIQSFLHLVKYYIFIANYLLFIQKKNKYKLIYTFMVYTEKR